ncbi:hypothetical protein RB595_010065 [Gaeumannomyces hyphopodioides]
MWPFDPKTPNLEITGLRSGDPDDFRRRFQRLINWLARPGSRPQLTALTISTTPHHHDNGDGGGGVETHVALATISFADPRAEARPFLVNLFAAGSADLLARVSSHGLLGFSAAAGGDLEQDWRLVVLAMLDAQGVERMALLGPAAAGMASVPEWLAVFECVVSVGLLFSEAASGAEAWGLIALFASNQVGLKGETTDAIKTLQSMVGRVTSALGEDKDEQAVFVASRVNKILDMSDEACRTMQMMVAGVEIDLDRSASLFRQLWEITGLISEAFRSSEYLVGVHRTHMYAHYGLGGGIFAAGAVAAVRQLITGGIRALSRTALASAGVGAAMSFYELRRGLGEKEKSDYYARLLHLLRHMWMAASELNTFLPKFRTAEDGTVEFRPGEQQHWEVYARNEVYKGAEVDQGWETAPAAIQYLHFRLGELESLRLQMEPLPPGAVGSA